ncbi:MAG: hypothetical protein N2556_01905, partial [Anaerolineae bacterium]|nr:hypothetical protein [Anaerolineae bacterium]
AQVRAALEERLRAGAPPARAAREVAALSGWPRREVYGILTAGQTDTEYGIRNTQYAVRNT